MQEDSARLFIVCGRTVSVRRSSYPCVRPVCDFRRHIGGAYFGSALPPVCKRCSSCATQEHELAAPFHSFGNVTSVKLIKDKGGEILVVLRPGERPRGPEGLLYRQLWISWLSADARLPSPRPLPVVLLSYTLSTAVCFGGA